MRDDKKAEEFERRTRRLYSDDTPKAEQDVIRAWLFGDEDSELKRDILCEAGLSLSRAKKLHDPEMTDELMAEKWGELAGRLGLDPEPENFIRLPETK